MIFQRIFFLDGNNFQKMELINTFLFEEKGFHGHPPVFSHPDTVLLDRVLGPPEAVDVEQRLSEVEALLEGAQGSVMQ